MSKVEFKYDKKQMPQIAVMIVLSVGMFGYFTVKMLTPPRPERAVAGTRKIKSELAKNTLLTAADIQVDSLTNGAVPSDGMHDPFIPQGVITTPKPTTQVATTPSPTSIVDANKLNALQPIPFSGSIKPLAGMYSGLSPNATAQAAPSSNWTVTGVLTGPTTSERVAILRNGDARRFVTLGAMVDDQYRLIGIDRFGVTLAQGKNRVRLALGGNPVKAASTGASSVTSVPLGNAISGQTTGGTSGLTFDPEAVKQITKQLSGAETPSEVLN